jgi:hypothetical protein
MRIFLALISCCVWFCIPVLADQAKTAEGTSEVGLVNIRFLPTSLTMNVEYSDQNDNRVLDAEETASIRVTVINEGPGKAYGVRVRGSASGSQNVSGKLDKEIGRLNSGDSATLVMTLTADEFVSDSTITVHLEATEKYGRSAAPLEVSVETRQLAEPDIQIVDIGIDDDDHRGCQVPDVDEER